MLRTDVVDEDGMAWPDEAPVLYVTGTVTVLEILTTVVDV